MSLSGRLKKNWKRIAADFYRIKKKRVLNVVPVLTSGFLSVFRAFKSFKSEPHECNLVVLGMIESSQLKTLRLSLKSLDTTC